MFRVLERAVPIWTVTHDGIELQDAHWCSILSVRGYPELAATTDLATCTNATCVCVREVHASFVTHDTPSGIISGFTRRCIDRVNLLKAVLIRSKITVLGSSA